MGVGKTTQVTYESGESVPDGRYLIDLAEKGFDVLYPLTGRRDQAALSDETQNLIDTYKDAPDHLKRAVFAALISPHSSDAKNAQTTPGWYRHELMGEEDVRYQEHADAKRERQLSGGSDTSTNEESVAEPPTVDLPGEQSTRRRPAVKGVRKG